MYQHRDLKMENSLYEDSSLVPIVKVIDFGLCAEIKGGETSRAFVGTVLYTASEVSTIIVCAPSPAPGWVNEGWCREGEILILNET